jgi:hypothetical protein
MSESDYYSPNFLQIISFSKELNIDSLSYICKFLESSNILAYRGVCKYYHDCIKLMSQYNPIFLKPKGENIGEILEITSIKLILDLEFSDPTRNLNGYHLINNLNYIFNSNNINNLNNKKNLIKLKITINGPIDKQINNLTNLTDLVLIRTSKVEFDMLNLPNLKSLQMDYMPSIGDGQIIKFPNLEKIIINTVMAKSLITSQGIKQLIKLKEINIYTNFHLFTNDLLDSGVNNVRLVNTYCIKNDIQFKGKYYHLNHEKMHLNFDIFYTYTYINIIRKLN